MLATPDYEEWKYYRKMTNFAFSPENIRKVRLKKLYVLVKADEQHISVFSHAYLDIVSCIAPGA